MSESALYRLIVTMKHSVSHGYFWMWKVQKPSFFILALPINCINVTESPSNFWSFKVELLIFHIQRSQVEVDRDASLGRCYGHAPLCGDQGRTKDVEKRLHLCYGLGTPQDSPREAGQREKYEVLDKWKKMDGLTLKPSILQL